MKTMRFHCEKIGFLGVTKVFPMETVMQEKFDMWRKLYESGTIERLQKLCNAKRVYGLYGAEIDRQKNTVTYQIACENKENVKSDEFDTIELEPTTYIGFKNKGVELLEKGSCCCQLYEEAENYMKHSKYISLIDQGLLEGIKGYAILEKFDPMDPEQTPYEMESWIPVHKK